MRSYSITLALVGMLIGILALTATAFARASIPDTQETSPPAALTEQTPGAGRPAVPVGATGRTPAAGARAETGLPELRPAAAAADRTAAAETGPLLRYVAFRLEGPEPGRLFLADADGNPLERIETDRDGDAALGPLAPGRYSVTVGRSTLGTFVLLDNAALSGADGQLRTDGELLYLRPLTSPATGVSVD